MQCVEKENHGEVSERSKEHAWKVCIRQRIEGSNPSLTAITRKNRFSETGFLYLNPTIPGLFDRFKRTGPFPFHLDMCPLRLSL